MTNKINAFLRVGVYSYTIFLEDDDCDDDDDDVDDDVDEKKSKGDVIKHGM